MNKGPLVNNDDLFPTFTGFGQDVNMLPSLNLTASLPLKIDV